MAEGLQLYPIAKQVEQIDWLSSPFQTITHKILYYNFIYIYYYILIISLLRKKINIFCRHLVEHAMLKALRVCKKYFIHKSCFGYKDNWVPDQLATQGRAQAEQLNWKVRVPEPLLSGGISFVAPVWRSPAISRES